MDIEGEYLIAAPRQRVWEALNDPEILKRCIPGCESIGQISPTELSARLVAAIGPVKAKFNTKLELRDLNPPESYTLAGESKGGAAGFGKGAAHVTLAEEPEGTRLRYQAEVRVGGKLAQVGSRLVVGATRKIADDFFGKFASEVDPGGAGAEAETAAAASKGGKNRLVLAIIAALIVLLLVWLLF